MQTANEAWISSIGDIMIEGEVIKPRGLETKEILNHTTRFDMNYPTCFHQDRKLSYKFMAAEAYWITSGSPLVEDIGPYNEHIKQYSDDGYIFNGAYGPAFVSQLNYVVNSLNKDNNTRQAVMTIWHPNPIDTKDFKCTLTLIFNIRDGKLNTTVIMRSNDMILGRPYDYFNFTVMTLKILTELNKDLPNCFNFGLGHLTLHAVSAHVYEDKYEIATKIINTPSEKALLEEMPKQCYHDWQYVVDSLLACRDMTETTGLWRIRPCV